MKRVILGTSGFPDVVQNTLLERGIVRRLNADQHAERLPGWSSSEHHLSYAAREEDVYWLALVRQFALFQTQIYRLRQCGEKIRSFFPSVWNSPWREMDFPPLYPGLAGDNPYKCQGLSVSAEPVRLSTALKTHLGILITDAKRIKTFKLRREKRITFDWSLHAKTRTTSWITPLEPAAKGKRSLRLKIFFVCEAD